MTLDHDAIRKAYPDAETIDDGFGVFDKDNKAFITSIIPPPLLNNSSKNH